MTDSKGAVNGQLCPDCGADHETLDEALACSVQHGDFEDLKESELRLLLRSQLDRRTRGLIRVELSKRNQWTPRESTIARTEEL